ncbi:MAG: conjugal transfer protein TraX [Synergistaceae bacterium]|nr:conjugal transfer protein TraX [Synergistaceae bacterium]
MSYELKSASPQGITAIFEKGLTGNTLKIIGIILMVFDHLHQMFLAQGVPNWFHWLGRPVAPIFLFMCAEGFHYTRSRGKYILRLFIGFICMNGANTALTFAMFNENVMLINNVFGTMMLTAIYLLFIETLREGIEEKQAGKITAGVLLMLLPAIASLAFVIALNTRSRLLTIVLSFIPNLIATEGGIPAVILGVLFYLCRGKRLMQTVILSLFSLLSFITNSESHSVQWLMIFALIPLLLYNGKRGKGNKYFFYVFYPAHIYLFYIVAWAIT